MITPGGPRMRHWWMIVCLLVIVAAVTATSVAVHGAARRPPAVGQVVEAGGSAVLTVRIDGPPDTSTTGSPSGGLVSRERTPATLLAIASSPSKHAVAAGSLSVPVLLFSSGGLRSSKHKPDRVSGDGRAGERPVPDARPRDRGRLDDPTLAHSSPRRAAAWAPDGQGQGPAAAPDIGTILTLTGRARATAPED